jgi:hypothetical protein
MAQPLHVWHPLSSMVPGPCPQRCSVHSQSSEGVRRLLPKAPHHPGWSPAFSLSTALVWFQRGQQLLSSCPSPLRSSSFILVNALEVVT